MSEPIKSLHDKRKRLNQVLKSDPNNAKAARRKQKISARIWKGEDKDMETKRQLAHRLNNKLKQNPEKPGLTKRLEAARTAAKLEEKKEPVVRLDSEPKEEPIRGKRKKPNMPRVPAMK